MNKHPCSYHVPVNDDLLSAIGPSWIKNHDHQPTITSHHSSDQPSNTMNHKPPNTRAQPSSFINQCPRFFIIIHFRVGKPKRFLSRSSRLLCFTFVIPDVFSHSSTIQSHQVFERFVNITSTLSTVWLLAGIWIGWALQPLAIALQPVFIQLLKEPAVLVAVWAGSVTAKVQQLLDPQLQLWPARSINQGKQIMTQSSLRYFKAYSWAWLVGVI